MTTAPHGKRNKVTVPERSAATAPKRTAFTAMALAAAVYCSPTTAESPARAAATRLSSPVERIAEHPDARRQRTRTGRTIATLAAFEGRLYAGYGDYSENTGPIVLRGLDPDSGRFTEPLARAPTEAVYLFREFDGTLVAPSIDPRGARGGFVRSETGGSTGWTVHEPVSATHVFDVLRREDGTWWLFGSEDLDAKVWRSDSGEAPFTAVLTVPPEEDSAFARFYGGFELEGIIHTQVRQIGLGPANVSRVFENDQWMDGPSLFPPNLPYTDHIVWKPTVHAGHAIYMDDHGGVTQIVNRLFRFDGTRAQFAFGNPDVYESNDPRDYVVDFTRAAGQIFVLNRLQEVWASSDLVTWERRAALDLPGRETATAVAVMGSTIYIGTNRSRIYRITGPPRPVTIPDASRRWTVSAGLLVILAVTAIWIWRRRQRGRK